MKKVFNLAVIVAVLAAAFSFTSCSKEGNIELTINSKEFPLGGPVTGTITSDNKIETVKIEKQDPDNIFQPFRTIQRKDFGAASGVVEAESGSYLLSITINEAGVYTIQAIDKDGNESQKVRFTIKSNGGGGINYNLTSFVAVAGDVYAYQHNGVERGTFTIASVTKGAGDTGYEVVFSNGITATISWVGDSYLMVDGSTVKGPAAVANSENLLLYIEGKTSTIQAGQNMGVTAPAVNNAKITKFAKQ